MVTRDVKGAYAPERVEEAFSKVRRSKRTVERTSKHYTKAWRHPFGVETQRPSSVRCIVMYQGVATRNGATT